MEEEEPPPEDPLEDGFSGIEDNQDALVQTADRVQLIMEEANRARRAGKLVKKPKKVGFVCWRFIIY